MEGHCIARVSICICIVAGFDVRTEEQTQSGNSP